MLIIKRDGTTEQFNWEKIDRVITKAFHAVDEHLNEDILSDIKDQLYFKGVVTVEDIQDQIEDALFECGYPRVGKAFIRYRDEHNRTREYVNKKKQFIENYKNSTNTANATIDDNSNVGNMNIGVLNAEIHKSENIDTSRGIIQDKLYELFPDTNLHKQYIKDLKSHIIYKHDESSFCGPIAPYCVSCSMYPFLLDGLSKLGGQSTKPTNLDSYCGMYVNLVFAISAQFAGAVATPEFLVYFDYFAKKEWGEDYWKRLDEIITGPGVKRVKTIRYQICQFFQQVIHSINQPAAARGMQSAFVNFAMFDEQFFHGMFDNFYFPDGTTQPTWNSVNTLQKLFMKWFNKERLTTILTFPVVSYALVYKDGKFLDENTAKFVAEEYSEGNSFFTYISDTVDSLSSCCRLKNKIQTKEFNFTNGNMGIETGSKSVITLNLSRIIQQWSIKEHRSGNSEINWESLKLYIEDILDRVYKYHIAYNECLWDMYDAGLLPVYSAGFIHLDKQYLTIGLNGLNQAAEFLGIQCNVNKDYEHFCEFIFGTIKASNTKNNRKFNNHKLTFNTEQVPSESLAAKNYNWDKNDGYWVPEDINLYTSYIFKPYDPSLEIYDKFILHGEKYIGDYLDGGAACHINLDSHPSYQQCLKMLEFAAKVGCQYFTFNIPNSQCEDCGFICKSPIHTCPKCGSYNISLWDRVIGYLTKIKNWSKARQLEQKKRVYSPIPKE